MLATRLSDLWSEPDCSLYNLCQNSILTSEFKSDLNLTSVIVCFEETKITLPLIKQIEVLKLSN